MDDRRDDPRRRVPTSAAPDGTFFRSFDPGSALAFSVSGGFAVSGAFAAGVGGGAGAGGGLVSIGREKAGAGVGLAAGATGFGGDGAAGSSARS